VQGRDPSKRAREFNRITNRIDAHFGGALSITGNETDLILEAFAKAQILQKQRISNSL
jgi:hypothetical protein